MCDPLLDEVAEKDRPLVLPLSRLVCVRPPLGVQMVEGPLNRDPSTIGEEELRGPRIEAYLAYFNSN